jgi:acetyl-CoA C-acetyltransferase
MRNVALIGAGVSKFGVRKASYRDLIWEAGKACFDSVPVKPKDVEGLVVGSPAVEDGLEQRLVAPPAQRRL